MYQTSLAGAALHAPNRILSEVAPDVVPDWHPEPPVKGKVVAVAQLSDCAFTERTKNSPKAEASIFFMS